MLKKFFDKANFIPSGLEGKAKKQSFFVSGLLILLFILSAFTFFNALYCFADIVGSIVCGSMDVVVKDLLRSIPIFLVFTMTLWTMLSVHASFRCFDEEKRIKVTFRNGVVIAAMAVITIIYIIVGLITKKYASLVEGAPSAIYPLDAFLYSLVFLCVGLFKIFYVKKLQSKFVFEGVNRGPVVKKLRGLYCTFLTFWMLIAIYGFAAFFIGLFIVDFLHGYQFYSVMLLIAFFLSPLFLGVWEFYYNELKEEKRKEFLLPLSVAGLAVSGLVTILYFVSLGLNLDAPSNIGFGILPVAFAASVNMATMICVITPLIVSVVALIKALIARKK